MPPGQAEAIAGVLDRVYLPVMLRRPLADEHGSRAHLKKKLTNLTAVASKCQSNCHKACNEVHMEDPSLPIGRWTDVDSTRGSSSDLPPVDEKLQKLLDKALYG